jgi:hypothetical protein
MLKSGPVRRIKPIAGRVRAEHRAFVRLMKQNRVDQVNQLVAGFQRSSTPTTDCGGPLAGPTRPSPRNS